jgi:hypothetical protein
LKLPDVCAGLGRAGYVHLHGPFDRESYFALANGLGEILSTEVIALRPGAHAYVAKPGRVPLHTDHPEVDIIGWMVEEQDADDGASVLLDTRPILAAMSDAQRTTLAGVLLECPLLAGGPPVTSFPVLCGTQGNAAVFCSPWLRAAGGAPEHQAALDHFRAVLSASARSSSIEIRVQPGEVLLVDNHRVLHGRRAIGEMSRRRLQRVWIRRPADPPAC